MSRLREYFNNDKVVLPVIHVESTKQVIRNASISNEAGCDGVFLISMGAVSNNEVLEIHRRLKSAIPSLWIGINLLGEPVNEIFSKVDNSVGGIWSDNAYIDERSSSQEMADLVNKKRQRDAWKGLYFGGVAFKYQREVKDLVLAAQIARGYMDVVTTSGDGTGSAPPLEKINVMRNALGRFPLAVASGISPENVSQFLPYVDCFMLATSLLYPGTEDFDPNRVKELVDIVRR